MAKAQLINKSEIPKEPKYNTSDEELSPVQACALKDEEKDPVQKITKSYFTDVDGNPLEKITKEKEVMLVVESENMGGEEIIIDLSDHYGDFKYEGELLTASKALKISVGGDSEKIKLEHVIRRKTKPPSGVSQKVDHKKIQKIDGGYPRNSRDFAGKNFSLDVEENPVLKARVDKTKPPPAKKKIREKKLKQLAKKYPEGVDFSEAGFPDFSPYMYEHEGVPVEVDIGALNPDPPSGKGTSGSQLDMNKANEMMKEKYEDWQQPEDYTWHHIENSTKLILVPTDLHGVVGHSGGRSTYKFD